MLLLFSLCRVIFYLFNTDLFPGMAPAEMFMALLAGLRFDLSAIVIINVLFILMHILPVPGRKHRIYQAIAEGLFYVTNGIALMANCLDVIYYRFTIKRTTFDIFSFLALDEGSDFFRLLPRYILDFWYIPVIWVVLLAIMVLLYRKTKKGFLPVKNRLGFYFRHFVLFWVFLLLFFVAGRGGFQLRPVSMISAGEYTSSQYIPIVLNTPFTLIQTAGKAQIEVKTYFTTEAALDRVFNPEHHFTGPQPQKKLNVVVIILEGFSSEHMGILNPGQEGRPGAGYTPFLDSLAAQGLLFTHAFANGKRSIEGIPAILAGLPNLMENPYITSAYAGNSINGLPYLLKKEGYSSAFFHGGNNGTMRFDAFSSLAGFDQYYGRQEYGNDGDFDGKWGIFDEPFLQYTANKINVMSEPFCASVFTLTSHHPYKIPEKYAGVFKKGTLEVHESIQYADFALKQFFKTASGMRWYSNTLFVITADHSSPTATPYYQNSMGIYAIPLIFFRPGGALAGRSSVITQQADIVPSVLDYLDYDGGCVAFGSSVFDSAAPHFSVSYSSNIYQLIHNDLLLQFNGEKTLAVYDIRNDSMLTNNLMNYGFAGYAGEEKYMKAVLQSYTSRMKENRLIIKN